MEIINKGKELLGDVKTYWKKPAEGRYMPFREIAAYSVGGIGAYCIFTMAQNLLLSTTNVIIGNTIGIQPMHMYIMYLISVVANVPLTMVRANMIDNVRYKTGKYRPYLLRMGIPTVIISMLFVFTPYDKVSYIWRCALIFIYNFGLQFFYNFFYDAYENLIHVLSPNTQERADTTAVKSVIYSLSPTITNFITPLIAGKVSNGDIYDLRVYRWLYPFIAVIGVALVVLVYTRTEEKIVIAKDHNMKVRFFDALREVAKNKYFWIISLAGWIGFLEGATGIILQWLYNYAHLCTPAQYAIITFIKGNAYMWGMVLSPFLIKKMGKKQLLIYTNLFNVLCLALVYPLMGNIWTVLACFYFNSIADSFLVVLNPTIQADIRDYQQYKTGERIDGMFAAVGLIGSFVTMATSSVLPAVYEKYGIFEGNGYDNMYDVLYDPNVLYKLVGVLVILSTVGAALNVVPFFFYDLTETRQKAIIKILQIRARLEEFGSGLLSDEDYRKTADFIAKEKITASQSKKDLSALKAAMKQRGLSKEEKKNIKKEYKEAVEFNEQIEISKAVLDELARFEAKEAQFRLDTARRTVAAGLSGIASADESVIEAAKALPHFTKDEKQFRNEVLSDARAIVRCKKAAQKYYPDGIKEFDASILDRLYEEETQLTEEKLSIMKELSEAKKAKNGDAAILSEKLKNASAKIAENSASIKEKTKELEHYTACTKAFTDAQRLLKQAENYSAFMSRQTL